MQRCFSLFHPSIMLQENIGSVLSIRKLFSCQLLSQKDNQVTDAALLSSTKDPSTCLIVENFVNRNPRNLEFLGIARKQIGWRFQYPPKSYYHKLLFVISPRHTSAYVEHSGGQKVISASTRELAIMQHLYSSTDVSAAENIGRVLAQRCLKFGISSVVLPHFENSCKSEKFTSFCKELSASGVELSEPDEIKPDYEPGIDYDSPEAINDLQRRQSLVHHLSEKSTMMEALNNQRGLRHGRRRFRGKTIPLEAPSWRSS